MVTPVAANIDGINFIAPSDQVTPDFAANIASFGGAPQTDALTASADVCIGTSLTNGTMKQGQYLASDNGRYIAVCRRMEA